MKFEKAVMNARVTHPTRGPGMIVSRDECDKSVEILWESSYTVVGSKSYQEHYEWIYTAREDAPKTALFLLEDLWLIGEVDNTPKPVYLHGEGCKCMKCKDFHFMARSNTNDFKDFVCYTCRN